MSTSAPVFLSVEALADRIPNGARIALPADYSGCAMAAVRALMRRPVRDLHIVSVPKAASRSTCWWVPVASRASRRPRSRWASTAWRRASPRPSRRARSRCGTLPARPSMPACRQPRKACRSCPARHHRLRPAARAPRLEGDRQSARRERHARSDRDLPAIRPDVTLFHALKADRQGNVWIGVQRELVTMAHASRNLRDGRAHRGHRFLRDPVLAAGTIPSLYITGIAEAPNGAWPVGLDNAYPADARALADYAAASATPEGFARWAAQPVSEAVG